MCEQVMPDSRAEEAIGLKTFLFLTAAKPAVQPEVKCVRASVRPRQIDEELPNFPGTGRDCRGVAELSGNHFLSLPLSLSLSAAIR